MTTHTLQGFILTEDVLGNFTSITTSELEIVAPDATTGLTYTVLSVDPMNGVPEVDITLNDYVTNIDGVDFDTALDPSVETEIIEVTWNGGASTTYLVNFFDPTTSLTHLYEIGGDALPSFPTVGDFNTFLSTATISGPSVGSGFEAGDTIPLAGAPGVVVTQNDLIPGTSGNDTLDGGLGNDTINGSAGADSITGGDGGDSIDGGDGNDTLLGGFFKDTVNGGAGDDLIQILASEFLDDVDGGTGTDTLDLSGALAADVDGDTFDFENGVINTFFTIGTSVTATSIEAYIDGAGGNIIFDRSIDFTVDAGAGNDTVHENAAGGNDNFDLGAGDDLLMINNAGIGGDTLEGGTGEDTVNYSNLTFGPGVVITLAGNKISQSGVNQALTGFEHVVGSQGAEVINGSTGNNILQGDAGNDTVRGFAGNDTIDGGLGADSLLGGFGDDSIDGGDGDDTINGQVGEDTINGGAGNDSIRSSFFSDTVFGGDGNDFIDGGALDDVLFGENDNDTIEGVTGNDSLDGGAGDDLLRGGKGIDTLVGGSGNDTLAGGENSDLLTGGDGLDNLQGQSGLDTLDGGVGNDTLIGGANADTFVFGLDYDVDRINDFANNQDILQLDDALWTGMLTAQQVVDMFATEANGNTRFDFGGGDVIVLAGFSVKQDLVDDIVFV